MSVRGRVKWFDAKKGFGFIIGPDGKDVFVHYTHIEGDGFKTLRDGETVDYELIQGDKGYQAHSVHAIATADPAPDDDSPAPDADADADDDAAPPSDY